MSSSPNLFQRFANAIFVEDTPDVTPVYEHSWPLTTGAAILLVLAFTAFTIYLYARERTAVSNVLRWSMASLRIAAFALLIFMMYGWMLRQHRVDLPDLAIAVDVSESMAAKDAYQSDERRQQLAPLANESLDQTTRLQLVKNAFTAENRGLLDQLARRFNVKLYFLAADASVQSGPLSNILGQAVAEGEQSRLGDGVRSVLELQRGRPTASLVLVSDGVTTAGQSLTSAAQYARRTSMPVFTIGVGDDQTPKDVRVSDLLVDEVAFAGDLIHFEFKLAASGYEGQKIRVRLHKEGDDTTLAETTVTLPGNDQTRQVRLSHREEEKGEFTFVVDADVLDKETDKDNNSLPRVIKVREETIRVLMVQEYPSFEFRFLKTMLDRGLKRDASGNEEKLIELTTILQEADLDYAELDDSAQRVFPVSRDELFAYDVLIFGDVDRSLFSNSTLQLIADFVRERGGGVVFLAGPRHTPLDYRDTPLADLFPFDVTTATAPPVDAILDETYAFGVRPTRVGMSSPQLQVGDTLPASLRAWSQTPDLHFLLETPDLRPAARTLLEHSEKRAPDGSPLPVVTLQFVGAGKVVFHHTDESHRWLRHPQGEQLFDRYWMQTIRFLARSRLLGGDRGAEVTSDRREYRRGDPVTLRVRFLDDRKAPPQDDGVVLVLEQAGGKRRQLRLTRDSAARESFETQLSGLVDGRYRAWLATPTLEGQPPSHEFTVTAPLGERSRLQMDRAELIRVAKLTGGKFLPLEQADRLLDDLPEGRKVRIESMPPEPIWNSHLFAGLLVACVVGEWLLRKRAGML